MIEPAASQAQVDSRSAERALAAVPRRQVLRGLGVLGVSGYLAACGSDEDGPTLPGGSSGATGENPGGGGTQGSGQGDGVAGAGGALPGETTCELTPAQTEGPFFFDTGLMRTDIRDGKAGVPLELTLRVVDSDGCTPIEGVLVEVWHADAAGAYSAFDVADGNSADASGETFLRGYQRTDAEGRVTFSTVYPGWYPGRTPHIHLMVHMGLPEGGSPGGVPSLLTTQLYFPEDITDAVYAEEPYAARGPRSTTNATDAFGGVSELVGQFTPSGDGYATSFRLVVTRSS